MANGGWTLIAHFSNGDSRNWITEKIEVDFLECRTAAAGGMTEQSLMAVLPCSTSNNYDMISPAFWLVQGNYIKVSRRDDSSNTGLLETNSCTGGRTFRSFITSFDNF